MVLSDRMEAIAAMVSPVEVLADIGTDHGYVPVALVERGIAKRAIAADVRRGPLSRAQQSIALAGLEQQIKTRLSDGLRGFAQGEADAIVIAGMGGALVIRILEEGNEIAHRAKELILQPQSEIAAVRRFLMRDGYEILDEDMICEDGKYYTVIKTAWNPEGKKAGNPELIKLSVTDNKQDNSMNLYEEAAMAYGPVLIEESHPVLKEYLIKESLQLQKIEDSIPKEGASPEALLRREEVARMRVINGFARERI